MSVSAEIKASKHEQAALLLAAGPSTAPPATGVGLSRRTILRREFVGRVTDLRAGPFKRSGRVLARCTTHAASRPGPAPRERGRARRAGCGPLRARANQRFGKQWNSNGVWRRSHNSCARPR